MIFGLNINSFGLSVGYLITSKYNKSTFIIIKTPLDQ